MRMTFELNHCFLVHRYVYGKNFNKDLISSFNVKLLTDRQTHRQMLAKT